VSDEIPAPLIHVVDGESHVFWVDRGNGHLRHGVVRTVRNGIVFAALTATDVAAVGIEELVLPPRFFTGENE
jgi:hypothetical protein